MSCRWDFIIITVPHAVCKSNFYIDHNCDFIAKPYSYQIKQILDKYGIDNKLFIGNINRKILDLNRIESKNTDFHKKLELFINKIKRKYKNILLIDIHSGDFGFDKSPIIIYDFPSCLDDNIIRNLLKNNIITKESLFKANTFNYIVNKYQNKGITSILIEINEDNIPDCEYLNNFIKSICFEGL